MDLARNTAPSRNHERGAGAFGSASDPLNRRRRFVPGLEPLQHAFIDIWDAQRVRCGMCGVCLDQVTYCLRLSELSAPESWPGGGATSVGWPRLG